MTLAFKLWLAVFQLICHNINIINMRPKHICFLSKDKEDNSCLDISSLDQIEVQRISSPVKLDQAETENKLFKL